METPTPIDRRGFLLKSGGLCCLGTALQMLDGCNSDDGVAPTPPANFTLDLTESNNSALQNVGGAIIKSGVLVIRVSTSTYVALSRICTHASCTVNYSAASGRLVCPCHGSIFSNTGMVVQGPATKALPTYNVAIDGDILTITS